MTEEILVSVLCMAYNQEKYIKEALNGILMQKTTFRYEIIVHDDASTDHTASIIRDYYKENPSTIIPILQTQNQYSQGKDIVDIMIEKVRGKYIAFCEGDDYWCDEDKLQKQVDFLEKNNSYSACSNSSWFLNEKTAQKLISFDVQDDIDIPLSDIVDWDINHYQTSSLVFRRKYLDVPKVYQMNGVGDYPRALYLALNGKIRYMREPMSVYRVFADNSWSSKIAQNREKMIAVYKDRADMVYRINVYTDGKYEQILMKKYRRDLFFAEMLSRNYIVAKRDYRDEYNELGVVKKIRFNINLILVLLGIKK